jgi:hypothetical protein
MLDDFIDVREEWREALREAHTVIAQSNETALTEGDEAYRSQLKRLIAENVMIGKGIVPRSFVFQGSCRRCGVVPLDTAVDGEILGCPWCASGARPTVYVYG